VSTLITSLTYEIYLNPRTWIPLLMVVIPRSTIAWKVFLFILHVPSSCTAWEIVPKLQLLTIILGCFLFHLCFFEFWWSCNPSIIFNQKQNKVKMGNNYFGGNILNVILWSHGLLYMTLCHVHILKHVSMYYLSYDHYWINNNAYLRSFRSSIMGPVG